MNETKDIERENKRERSSRNPLGNLEEAVKALETVNKALGKGPYSRDSVAQALGYSGVHGRSGRKVAALVQFGLLNREGNKYSQSDLASRILFPVSDQDKIEAIIIAVKSPTLYAKLIAKYENQSLPTLLANIMAREYGINSKNSEEAAKTFKESLEYAGIFKNGVILDQSSGLVNNQGTENDVFEESSDARKQLKESPSQTSGANLKSLELPSGIVVLYPNSLAYKFALGEFAQALKLLNETALSASDNNTNGTDHTTT